MITEREEPYKHAQIINGLFASGPANGEIRQQKLSALRMLGIKNVSGRQANPSVLQKEPMTATTLPVDFLACDF